MYVIPSWRALMKSCHIPPTQSQHWKLIHDHQCHLLTAPCAAVTAHSWWQNYCPLQYQHHPHAQTDPRAAVSALGMVPKHGHFYFLQSFFCWQNDRTAHFLNGLHVVPHTWVLNSQYFTDFECLQCRHLSCHPTALKREDTEIFSNSMDLLIVSSESNL